LFAGGRPAAGIDIAGKVTMTNDGTIAATALAAGPGFASVGAYLGDGGSVTNGAKTGLVAQISGASEGVAAIGAVATVTNFGTIAGGAPGDMLLTHS
jgi:hypothetical protein